MKTVAGAVLAAGLGVRMGAPKARLEVAGERLIDRAVSAAVAGGCAPVFAVLPPGVEMTGAEVVVNPAPERGMRSSLVLAVDAASGADAMLVLLADQPGIGAAAVAAVREAWRPGRVAVARYSERRGHPVAMAPDLWQAALALAGPDEGARAFLASRPDLLDEVDVPGDPADLDTPQDLARWVGDHPPP